jgi:hypothetical protein
MALFDSMNQNKNLTATLGEPAHITERREFLLKRLHLMKNSMKVLQRDPDIANSAGDDVERAMRAAGPPARRGPPPNQGGNPNMRPGPPNQGRPNPN